MGTFELASLLPAGKKKTFNTQPSGPKMSTLKPDINISYVDPNSPLGKQMSTSEPYVFDKNISYVDPNSPLGKQMSMSGQGPLSRDINVLDTNSSIKPNTMQPQISNISALPTKQLSVSNNQKSLFDQDAYNKIQSQLPQPFIIGDRNYTDPLIKDPTSLFQSIANYGRANTALRNNTGTSGSSGYTAPTNSSNTPNTSSVNTQQYGLITNGIGGTYAYDSPQGLIMTNTNGQPVMYAKDGVLYDYNNNSQLGTYDDKTLTVDGVTYNWSFDGKNYSINDIPQVGNTQPNSGGGGGYIPNTGGTGGTTPVGGTNPGGGGNTQPNTGGTGGSSGGDGGFQYPLLPGSGMTPTDDGFSMNVGGSTYTTQRQQYNPTAGLVTVAQNNAPTATLNDYSPNLQATTSQQFYDYSKLQDDVYKGIELEVQKAKENAMKDLDAKMAAAGIYRSGLTLDNAQELEKAAMDSLAKGYGDVAMNIANLQNQAAQFDATQQQQADAWNAQTSFDISKYNADVQNAFKTQNYSALMNMAVQDQNTINDAAKYNIEVKNAYDELAFKWAASLLDQQIREYAANLDYLAKEGNTIAQYGTDEANKNWSLFSPNIYNRIGGSLGIGNGSTNSYDITAVQNQLQQQQQQYEALQQQYEDLLDRVNRYFAPNGEGDFGGN